MADVAVEQNETPVVEKEVVEVDAPKVVDEETETVGNGKDAVSNGKDAVAPEATENGNEEEEKTTTEEKPAEEVKSGEVHEGVNGDSIEGAPETVKRKAVEEPTDAAEVADEAAPTPEKKSKVEEVAQNGEEVVA